MCYCAKEKHLRGAMIVLGSLLIIPGILLFIFGGIFKHQIKVLTNTDAGTSMGQTASAITFLFACMVMYIGIKAIVIGCMHTRCPKLARCCSCIYAVKSALFFLIFFILGIVFLAISSWGTKYTD